MLVTPPLAAAAAAPALPQVNDDFFIRTASGGVVTLVAAAIMLILFLNELRACLGAGGRHHTRLLSPTSTRSPGLFLHVRTEYALDVDTSRGDTIQINVRAQCPSPPPVRQLRHSRMRLSSYTRPRCWCAAGHHVPPHAV